MSKKKGQNVTLPDENAAAEQTEQSAVIEEIKETRPVQTAEISSDVPAAPAQVPKSSKKRKKAPPVRLSVIISLFLVVAAIVGYLIADRIYYDYYYHTPKDILWTRTDDVGNIYYYEFSEDDIYTITVGSIEQRMDYEQLSINGDDYIRIYAVNGFVDYRYSISGSRKNSDQEMTLTYGDNTDPIVFTQTQEKIDPLELPEDFEADPDLVGEWECSVNGTYYKLTINDDGSFIDEMTGLTADGRQFTKIERATYTLGDTINLTKAIPIKNEETGQYEVKNDTTLEPYELDGDQLTFQRKTYTRIITDEMREASPDEATLDEATPIEA